MEIYKHKNRKPERYYAAFDNQYFEYDYDKNMDEVEVTPIGLAKFKRRINKSDSEETEFEALPDKVQSRIKDKAHHSHDL